MKKGDRLTKYLTYLEDAGIKCYPSGQKHQLIKVRCDCGIEKIVQLSSVKSGLSKSCGRCARLSSPDLTKEYILSNILVNTVTECWEWQRSSKGVGYGQTSTTSGQLSAHKASWIVFKGPVSEDALVLHKCDNRICCNPDHLYLGDHSSNMRDRWNNKDNVACRELLSRRVKEGNLREAFKRGRKIGQQNQKKEK